MSSEEGSSKTFFDAVTEFVASPEGLSREEVRMQLEIEGVDVKRLGDRYHQFVAGTRKAQRKSFLDDARARMLSTALEIKQKASRYASLTRDELLSQLQSLGHREPVQAFFRDLSVEQMPDEELRELLAQLQIGTDENLEGES